MSSLPDRPQRRSVIILWLWTALLSVFVLYPAYTGKGDALAPLAVAAICLLLFTMLHPGRHRLSGSETADGECSGEVPGDAGDDLVSEGDFDDTAVLHGESASDSSHDLQLSDPSE